MPSPLRIPWIHRGWTPAKDKGGKERYTNLNAEFQRIARRDKKGFLSDQCKEIEENNGMGKTRDPFKKIRYQGNISNQTPSVAGVQPQWIQGIRRVEESARKTYLFITIRLD